MLDPQGGCDTSLGATQKWISKKIALVLLALVLNGHSNYRYEL